MHRAPSLQSHSLRAARTSAILLAAFAAAGCSHAGGTGGIVPGTECELSADLKSATPKRLFACAHTVAGSGDRRDGTGDTQRLAVTGPYGKLTYGPVATITPLRNFLGNAEVTAVSEKSLAHGLPLAVVQSDSAYPKLGLLKGANVLVVAVPVGADSGTAAMIPLEGSAVTFLTVRVTSHKDPADFPLATARWIWSDKDETIWVACGTKCCSVKPAE